MTTATTPGATAVIARFACGSGPRPHNAGDVGTVLVDTVGVAIAGLAAEPVRVLLDWLRGEAAPGPGAVWGGDLMLAPSQAALVNGTAAHALDWDDAAPAMAMHPAAVLLPALLAQAAVDEVSGEALVEAYDAGSAVLRAVSEALPIGAHYERGFHNTATSGRLAAVAALARLLRLEEDVTCHALGIAASFAAGSLANFGTMTKPLHAGAAARDAVTAVGLARRGFTANQAQLEAPTGFFAMYGEPTATGLADLRDRLTWWEREWVTDFAIKRYPSCYATHKPIDAALDLRVRLPAGAVIDRVDVAVRPGGLRPLITGLPRTGLAGKFSMHYTVALALARGGVRLADFTDADVADERMRQLMRRIEVSECAALETDPGQPTVRVRLADGSVLQHRVDISYGDARNPLSAAHLMDKFLDACAAGRWDRPAAHALVRTLRAAVGATTLMNVQGELSRAGKESR